MDGAEFAYLDMEGNSCAPEVVLNKIPQVNFEDFVWRLDSSVQRIVVTPITPGRSGAATFLIRRVTNQTKLMPIVVKAATNASIIINERQNYENHIKARLGHAPQLIASDSLALAYEFASGLFHKPVTLRDGYASTEPSLLVALIKKLVAVLSSWYQHYPSEISNIENMTFPSPLAERLVALGNNFEKYSFLDQWWGDFKRVRRMASPCSLYLSHGDLNVGNVLYDIESADPVPLFIDFGSVKKAITYWDFVKIERDLKTRTFLRESLNRGIKTSSIVEVIRKIDAVDLSQPSSDHGIPSATSPQQKVWECVMALRKEIVNQTGTEQFNHAYYDSLAFSTLTVLYRDDPDNGIPLELQRIVACESAAALLSRILQRPLPNSLAPPETTDRLDLTEESLKGVVRYSKLTHSNFLRFIKERVIHTYYGDIKYLTIAGWEVFRNEQIAAALRDANPPSQSKTLRVYVLRPETKSFEEFVRISNEPPEILIEKIENTRAALKKWSESPEYSGLRIKLYLYDAIPVLNLLETPDCYAFRPYKIGEAQGLFSIFEVNKMTHPNGISLFIKNYIRDLAQRSEEITMRWF